MQPLIDAIAPATYTNVSLLSTTGQPHIHRLGPSNANGISSQPVWTGDRDANDGTVIKTTSANNLFPNLSAHTHFANPGGWAIISDIDDTIKVTNKTLAKVPFDIARWSRVAAETGSLPGRSVTDPTQWLFNGHPKGSDQPLHVAVARLLGYQWPRQTGSSFPDCPALGPDGLEKRADDDGIVCLPAINREQRAANRLRNLLAPGTEGGFTRYLGKPGEFAEDIMTIYDAAERYRQEHVPLIVLAGKD